jgi:hypothetical protein
MRYSSPPESNRPMRKSPDEQHPASLFIKREVAEREERNLMSGWVGVKV